MQPQPQTIALNQAPPPFGRGGSFLFGRGIGVGSSQPFLRVGRLMPANELLRQRMQPDLIACPDFLQRQTEGPHKPYDSQWGSKGGRGLPLNLTADVVGYTGGGGGAGRVSLSLTPQYTSVAAPHPSNSAAQVQQASQNQQIRNQAPPLPPSHNPHNSAGAPPPSATHSQHLSHPHSALAQHHHQVLTGGNVSAAAGGLANPVPQTGVAVNPGQSPAPPGPQHELNQGIPQATSQQLQQGSGVPLAGSVAGTHSMMYPTTNPNQIQQNPQSNNQVRGLINQQYYTHGQQNAAAAHLHPGSQQHRQLMQHPQPSMQGYSYLPPLVQQPYINAAQFTAAALAQHRPGTSNSQHQFAAQIPATPQSHFHFSMAAPVQNYQFMDSSGKNGWNVKGAYGGAPTMYYHTPQNKVNPAPAPPVQREKKMLAIIDPLTNKNILEDISPAVKPSPSPSPMQSRESSTANTPAPSGDSIQTKPTSQHIPSEFALRVALLQGDASSGVSNEQSESIECDLSTNKSIEPSHCVISSELSEKDNRINCVDIKIEPINEINQNIIVPEHSTISKCEQPITIQSPTSSLPPQFPQSDNHADISPTPTSNAPQNQAQTQPPPQPQRPAKQPRGSQQQHQNMHSAQGNHAKGANQQQQSTNKQQSPPQHGNKNQNKGGAAHMPQKGSQAAQGQQQQQAAKGRSSPNAQQQKNANNQAAQQHHQGHQQNKQNLPQTQQSKLPNDNMQQASKMQQPHVPPQQMHQANQASSQQQPQVQPLKEQGVSMHQGSTHQMQGQHPKVLPQSQGFRGSSPPQQTPAATQGVAGRRMSGEQPPSASAGPIKSEKRQSPSLEHVPSVVAETLKEPVVNKPNAAKSASVSPVLAPGKKETTPEPTQAGPGKRGGKDKNEDLAQSKDSKDIPRVQIEEPTPRGTPDMTSATQANKQLSQGKPPKSQSSSNEKGAEAMQPPTQSTSQSPKPESPSPQEQPRNAPSRAPLIETPESVASNGVDSSNSISSLPVKPEADDVEVNHVDEVQVNNHEENHVSEKPKSSSLKKYNYKEGQWSPENQDGKRQYDRDFLLEMQRNPLSLRRPDSLPNLEVVLDGVNRPMDGKHKIVSDFTPSFLQNSNRRTQKFATRNSQQGKKGSDKGDKDKNMGDLRVFSINFDNRLQKSSNAWKPAAKKSDSSDEEISTVRKMRGILNKLTPDNFEKLVDQVRNMNIKKFATFDKVIGLIFEKAVDEQAFSTTYAELCKVLSQMSVKVEEKEDGNSRFRNLIINKCQTEFEKDKRKDLNREEKEKEIAAETEEKRTELKAILDFEETRLRKRSVGNIRFIGELYKLKMLTSSIMMRIILALLVNKDEEALECLCKLLTTIGKMLEMNAQNSTKAQGDLNEIFTAMKELVESRNTSSRVRFLLMDVIDLRRNNWIPRREDAKPKKKAEVHEEIRKEEMEQQFLLSTAPRKDDRERKRSRDNRGIDNRGMTSDEGWSIASNPRRGPFDSSRLRSNTFRNPADNNVEFRAGFSNWARGSSGGVKDQEDESRPCNRFAVLEQFQPQQAENRRNNAMSFNQSFRPPRLAPGGSNPSHRQGTSSFGSKSMPPPSEKENVGVSTKIMTSSGDRSKSNSRSNSRHSSRENSLVREHQVAPPLREVVVQPFVPISDDDALKFTKPLVEEFAANDDIKEAVLCIQEKFKGKNIVKFVQFSLEWVLDRDADKRRKIGNLYHHLLKNRLLSLTQFIEGSRDILEMIPDFEIDVPQVCTYIGGILSHLLVDNIVRLDDILKIIEPSGPRVATIFAKVIKEASSVLGEMRVRDMWKSSNIDLLKVLPDDTLLQDYLSKHDILFIITESLTYNNRPISDEEAPIDPKIVRKELARLFKSQAEEEEIFGWIEKYVGRFTNTKKFVRALTAALLVSLLTSPDGTSYVTGPEFEAKLREKAKFIYKYVDNNQHLELACVYSIQALSVEYQHPSGLLEKTFNVLYDSEFISDETFFNWEKSDDPEEQVGKGVCVTSVNKFLKWLKEADQEVEQEPTESGIEEN